MIAQSRIPIPSPFVVLREEFDDWAILFNPESANTVGINPIGVAVWKLLDGRKGVDDLVIQIREQFSDVPDKAAEEISAFIDDLYDSGFVGYDMER